MYQSRKLSIFVTGKAYSLSGLLLLFLVATSTFVHGQQPNAPGAEEPPEIVDSAAVRAIRATDPQTPEQLLRAIDQLIRLDRFDLALDYLQQLNDQGLDVAARAQLHQKFGTSVMLKLLRPEMEPLGREFALATLSAAKAYAQDPQRIARDIQQLAATDRQTQLRAALELSRSGEFAVPQLIEAIAASTNPELTKNAKSVLIELGSEAVDPLIATLSSSNDPLRLAAIDALGRLGRERALAYLVRSYLAPRDESERQAAAQAFRRILGSEPTRFEATQLLRQSAQQAYQRQITQKADIDGVISIWAWNEELQSAIPYRLFSEDVAALTASRLYRDLFAVDPDDNEHRIRYLASRLELDQAMALDRPLRRGAGTAFEEGVAAGTQVVEQVLQESIKNGHWIGAIAAAEILGEIGDVKTLRAPAGKVSPLVLLLTDPHRRVRFAALQAIMKLNPQASFPGASRLPQALGFFAGSTGSRRILIAHPLPQEGHNLAGLAHNAGFEAEVVTDPKRITARAIASPDLELIMISDAIRGASLWSLIQSLRSDPKSADIPILLMGYQPNSLTKLEQIASSDSRVLAFTQPLESDFFGQVVAMAIQTAGRDLMDRGRRIDQAAMALDWLAQLAEGDPNRYSTLLRQQDRILAALTVPELADHARRVAINLPTASAQLALADLASQPTFSLADRQAAASAFDESIQKNGILMTNAEIHRQYDRYNRSRNLDQPTQKVLGSLLDSIEAPSRGNQEP